jgi:hypothetical protein
MSWAVVRFKNGPERVNGGNSFNVDRFGLNSIARKKAAQKNEQLAIYSSVSRVNLIEPEIQSQAPQFMNKHVE